MTIRTTREDGRFIGGVDLKSGITYWFSGSASTSRSGARSLARTRVRLALRDHRISASDLA